MSKRPTPKKRKAKSAGRTQHSVFIHQEVRRLTGLMNSPYGKLAANKDKAGKALKGITRIKA